MGILIQVRGADKNYGEQILLDDAEVTLNDGVKVGFVGRNGAGKSTLLRVLLEEEELDKGEVTKSSYLRVGYLRQHDPFLPGESALDFLMRDSGKPDWKCGEVGGEFELKGEYLTGPVSALSGGWQTRVKLASLLLQEPNLLLLDEPTNFLDIRTQILLEHFLRRFKQAALIVSHDRSFLQATCTHTLDLSRGKLTMYPGRIEEFLVYQAERREHDEKVNATVVAKQKHLQKFIDKNRARASTASQARSKGKQLERLRTLDIADDLPTASIRAPIVTPREGPAVRLMDLSIGYPESKGNAAHTVASDIELEIEHGQRAAIVGDNGQGKTTLLRTIVGSLEPLAGKTKWGHHCEIGVYAQHVYGSLDESQTVLEYLEYKATPGTTNQMVLAVAGSLLFRDAHVRKKIKVLSGGERARLCMAGLLLGPYNILVLDEPGNHLDVETVESLSDALLEYQGTVIFTSHDRHFMKRLATSIIEVRDQTAKTYSGDYDSYLYYINKEIDDGERNRSPKQTKGNKSKNNNSKSKANGKSGGKNNKNGADQGADLLELDPRKAAKQLKNLEKKIRTLDTQRTEMKDLMMQETDPDEALRLHNEFKALEMDLGEAEERWLELSAALND
ncbi:MAG: ABC-F family ATP-binding cassette domain-containing protein [Pirellulaceae bacterium]